jgi:putative oxidoreductase
MPPKVTLFAAPLGRFLLSLIFVASAAGKLTDWQGTTQIMAAKNVPVIDVLLSIAIVLEIVGGLMVLLGLNARWGAVVLLVFLIPVTVIMHNFWALPEAEQREQMINFMKNISIMGGLLMVVALGPGPFSIDNWWRKPRPASGP